MTATHWIAVYPPKPGGTGATLPPRHVEGTTAEILRWFETPQPVTRKHASVLVFLGDARACDRKDATAFAPLLPVDVDDGHAPVGWVPPDTFGGVAYTTASSTPAAPRFRLMIELDRPPTREEIKPATRAAAALLGLGHDGCTESGSQGIYPPILGATVWRRHGAPWPVDALVAAGGGVVEAPRRRGLPDSGRPADREPVHPATAEERIARWSRAIAGAKLPTVADTSGTLTGHRGMRAVRPLVFAGIGHGVALEAIVAGVSAIAAPMGWDADDVEAAVDSAWRYSDKAAVEWEAELPRVDAPAWAPASTSVDLSRPGVLLVGPPGCGKTKRTIEATSGAGSLLWLAPRTKLASDAAARAGLDLYGERGDTHSDRLACTHHSAHKYPTPPSLTGAGWDTVVLDEIATIVGEIDARAFAAVRSICAQARRVIALGADVDGAVAAIARMLVGRELEVQALPGAPLSRELAIEHANTTIGRILADTGPGCMLVATDAADRAEAIAAVLRESRGDAYPVAVFRGGGDGAVPTDETVRTHRAIICTHSMAEAVSLEAPIRRVYLLHTFDAVHPRTLLQLAARARNVEDTTIHCGELAWGRRDPADAEAVRERIDALLDHEHTPAMPDEPLDRETGAIAARALREWRALDAEARPSIATHAPAVGWPVTRYNVPARAPKLDRHWRQRLDAAAGALDAARCAAVVAAEPVERLAVRPTAEQRAGHHHAQLVACKLAVNDATVAADKGGRLRARVRRLALARLAAEPQDAHALARACERLDKRARIDRAGLLARARLDADFLKARAAEREGGPPEGGWGKWVDDRRKRLAAAGLVRPTKAKIEAWLKAWDAALAVDAIEVERAAGALAIEWRAS